MNDIEVEIYLKGAPVSEGIAIGISHFHAPLEQEDVPEFPIKHSEVDQEIYRYRRALSSSREDLRRLQAHLAKEGSTEVLSIIGSHIQMLEDPLMKNVEGKIREMLKNAETVFQTVINDYEQSFSHIPDSFFHQRIIDVKDLSQRVMRHLRPRTRPFLDGIPASAVLFTRELIPSDTAALEASKVCAVVTQGGGGTSHTALIARAKGIPYVANISLENLKEHQGKQVIVDGETGEIIINPSPESLQRYREKQKEKARLQHHLEGDRKLTAETIDGYPVKIYANAASLSDFDLVHHYEASGVGLFRSEYLFLQERTLFFDEQAQYDAYVAMLHKAKDLSVVFRVMDLGGDKYPAFFPDLLHEPNPVLGCRGIRFLMRYPDIFKIQLRAILRASIEGNVRLLLPLISDIHELRDAKQVIEEVKQQLKAEGAPIADHIPLGCMLEVPSAVLVCDALASECDFLAIGTNDLIQYTLGIDRSNPAMSDFYYPTHPGVIRMIKMIVIEAKRQNKPVTICGEIAANPLFIPLLLGLGIQKFSCTPRFIPLLKRSIRKYTILEAQKIADEVLQFKTSSDIAHYLLGIIESKEKASS